MKTELCARLPDLAQDTVLRYLNYVVIEKRYIKIGKLTEERVRNIRDFYQYYRREVEEVDYTPQYMFEDPEVEQGATTLVSVGSYIDDAGDEHWYDEDGNETYFRVTLRLSHKYVPGSGKMASELRDMNICFSRTNSNKFSVNTTWYIVSE
jgi:hypothetical protein